MPLAFCSHPDSNCGQHPTLSNNTPDPNLLNVHMHSTPGK